ncbi:MAG: protoheme IX farnesyltransferase [Candidatus Handelsmanbacteria bacterium RIFCSPLOWO2_12_FULL_64_10]|uniref:Protoheme IX farnesyltransferase n=1 Tax=Handelsmanbacteria sp. (strain RIFCSPLOWO2_12_FULL_64_10) TaxID=1817868 RepID=A0A1F6CJZ3_HANXR|nr:MAG: protoheme IX farnesyltransferase [Candidatus Handelsmanbacteria bacterium RIFCSPLOWO2_12_FULL_64_10]
MSPQVDTSSASLSLPWALASDFAELTKPRIVAFVCLSTLVGFVLGSVGPVNLGLLLHALIGTAMASGGTAALNQFLERDIDARMTRTAGRPLPAGRLGPEEAHCFGVLLSASGIFYLGMSVNWATGLTAALTLAIYLFLYTPLKLRTPLNTAVGAVAGALPPVGGWVAAAGGLAPGAWALFAILFLWQFPHVLAITWLFREDYARGGCRMVSVLDPDGRRTGRQVVAYSLVLLPFSLLPAFLGMAGLFCFCASLLLGLTFLGFGLRFRQARTPRRARLLMLASLVYLPALWLLMVFDRILV